MLKKAIGENTDDMRPTAAERGDLMRLIKNYALEGYLRAKVGSKEEFDKMWREAFNAD